MKEELGTRFRPDPYVDWELQSDPKAKDMDRWCSVMVKVAGHQPKERLKNLKSLAERGKCGTDVRMTSDEHANLKKTIERLKSEIGEQQKNYSAESTGVRFFIYLRESQTFLDPSTAKKQGSFYRSDDNFEIIFSGPPIKSPSSQSTNDYDIDDCTAFTNLNSEKSPKVITAIIDDGIAFANERFCMNDPNDEHKIATRVAAIWLQDVEDIDKGVMFGKRLQCEDMDEINDLISKGVDDDVIYRKFGALDFTKDHHQSLAYRLTHGTHVMDLASGMGPFSKDEKCVHEDGGKAATLTPQEHPILAVQLPSPVTANTSGQMLASYVLQAVRTIMLWTDEIGEKYGQTDLPLVINFSYGYSAGPKDGSLFIEREIDRLIQERDAPTVVVLPAGNNYLSRTTAKFKLGKGGKLKSKEYEEKAKEIGWMIPPDDQTDNFVEIWVEDDTEDDAPISLELTGPSGEHITNIGLKEGSVKVLRRDQSALAALYYDRTLNRQNEKRHRYFLAVARTKKTDGDRAIAQCGEWKIKITNNRENNKLTAWCHIQRDDTPGTYTRRGRQSYFDHEKAYGRDERTGDYSALMPKCPITHEATINAIASGDETVVIGSVIDDMLDQQPWPPAEYSAQAHPAMQDKPLASAITESGHALPGVMAAGTRSGSVVRMRGTSAAAPQAARLLADLLAGGMSATQAIECIKNGKPKGRVQKLDCPDSRRGHAIVNTSKMNHIPRRGYPKT